MCLLLFSSLEDITIYQPNTRGCIKEFPFNFIFSFPFRVFRLLRSWFLRSDCLCKLLLFQFLLISLFLLCFNFILLDSFLFLPFFLLKSELLLLFLLLLSKHSCKTRIVFDKSLLYFFLFNFLLYFSSFSLSKNITS